MSIVPNGVTLIGLQICGLWDRLNMSDVHHNGHQSTQVKGEREETGAFQEACRHFSKDRTPLVYPWTRCKVWYDAGVTAGVRADMTERADVTESRCRNGAAEKGLHLGCFSRWVQELREVYTGQASWHSDHANIPDAHQPEQLCTLISMTAADITMSERQAQWQRRPGCLSCVSSSAARLPFLKSRVTPAR